MEPNEFVKLFRDAVLSADESAIRKVLAEYEPSPDEEESIRYWTEFVPPPTIPHRNQDPPLNHRLRPNLPLSSNITSHPLYIATACNSKLAVELIVDHFASTLEAHFGMVVLGTLQPYSRVDTNCVNSDGWRLLRRLVSERVNFNRRFTLYHRIILKNDFMNDVIAELLELPLDLNAKPESTSLLIVILAEENRYEVCLNMLSKGALPDYSESSSYSGTFLHSAARVHRHDALAEAFRYFPYANASVPRCDGVTPLHEVVEKRGVDADRIRCLEILLRHGADPDMEDCSGFDPIAYAIGLHGLDLPLWERPYSFLTGAELKLFKEHGADMERVRPYINMSLREWLEKHPQAIVDPK